MLLTFYYGAKLDFSIAAYASFLPLVLTFLSRWLNPQLSFRLYNGYLLVLSLLIVFLSIADLELFSAWGFRIDTTPLLYLSNPKEAMASSSTAPFFLLGIILVGLSSVVIWSIRILRKHAWIDYTQKTPVEHLITLALLFALIIPVRGGFQLAPMNISHVYFSSKPFANQAAINATWNFLYDLNIDQDQNPFEYFPEDQVSDLAKPLFYDSLSDDRISLINTDRPNVIFIIWESFTAKAVASLGGRNVTSDFDRLVSEGIYFTGLHASGDRSDKGLVSIMSGYPAVGQKSIMKTPRKAANSRI